MQLVDPRTNQYYDVPDYALRAPAQNNFLQTLQGNLYGQNPPIIPNLPPYQPLPQQFQAPIQPQPTQQASPITPAAAANANNTVKAVLSVNEAHTDVLPLGAVNFFHNTADNEIYLARYDNTGKKIIETFKPQNLNDTGNQEQSTAELTTIKEKLNELTGINSKLDELKAMIGG